MAIRTYRPRARKPQVARNPTPAAAKADAFKQARRLARGKKPK